VGDCDDSSFGYQGNIFERGILPAIPGKVALAEGCEMRDVRWRENFANQLSRQDGKTAASLSMPHLPDAILGKNGYDPPGFAFAFENMVQGGRPGLQFEGKNQNHQSAE
jgi:hypothetical protein